MTDLTKDSPVLQDEKYERLIAAARKEPPIKVAVAHPCDDASLRGAIEAHKLGLIEPILVAPPERVQKAAKEAAFDALRRRGIYPINHTVVIRNDALQANPALASDVFDVFVEAKRLYLDRLRSGRVADADSTHLRVMEAVGDPLPYGIEENRRNLEAIVQYSVEQGILSRPFRIEELFASRG